MKRTKMKILKRTAHVDRAYIWSADGPGWSNFGISYPIEELVERTGPEGKTVVTSHYEETIQRPSDSAVAICLQAQRIVTQLAGEHEAKKARRSRKSK